MRTFIRVAERGSLSAVAREFGVGQSTISRQLRELEEALGVPLLGRTTRRLALTPEGARYHADVVQILRLVEQATDETRGDHASASGTIRLTCTAALGVLHVSRLIFAFQDLYPAIDIDLNLTDERIDLVREGVDLALRLGPLSDSSVRLRRLGRSERVLTAAPAYLAARGRPAAPEDLYGHEGVRMSNVSGSETLVLENRATDRRHHVPLEGRLRVDHGLAAREAVLAGRGIAPTHRWLVDDLLADGRLERVLSDYSLDAVPLSLLIVPARADIARVRLLAAFLTERIAEIPGITR